jgi:hypothetical protein
MKGLMSKLTEGMHSSHENSSAAVAASATAAWGVLTLETCTLPEVLLLSQHNMLSMTIDRGTTTYTRNRMGNMVDEQADCVQAESVTHKHSQLQLQPQQQQLLVPQLHTTAETKEALLLRQHSMLNTSNYTRSSVGERDDEQGKRAHAQFGTYIQSQLGLQPRQQQLRSPQHVQELEGEVCLLSQHDMPDIYT